MSDTRFDEMLDKVKEVFPLYSSEDKVEIAHLLLGLLPDPAPSTKPDAVALAPEAVRWEIYEKSLKERTRLRAALATAEAERDRLRNAYAGAKRREDEQERALAGYRGTLRQRAARTADLATEREAHKIMEYASRLEAAREDADGLADALRKLLSSGTFTAIARRALAAHDARRNRAAEEAGDGGGT